jgi:hypothetical protein
MTANSFLLDKVGKGIESDGSSVYDPDPYLPSIVNYDQYKWRPEFSCSGLPFSGSLARPNDPAPTDKSKFPDSLFMPVFKPPPDFDASQIASGGSVYWGSTIHNPRISYTANGQLRGDSGGFYPYRYQKHPMSHISEEGGIFEKVIDGSITPKEEIMTLFANYAAAPFESEEAGLIAGQIVNDHIIRDKFYIGYQYNIRRLSSPGIFHPHGSVPENNEAVDNRNVPTSGPDIKNQTAYIGGAMNTKAGSAPSAVASYDKTKTHAPKYKYWVLRIPVSIPEYTS